MNAISIDNLVLGTVNASWKREIDAATLAALMKAGKVDGWLVHLATFFGEVRSQLILLFADAHGVSKADLFLTYSKVKVMTGEANLSLESELVKLA